MEQRIIKFRVWEKKLNRFLDWEKYNHLLLTFKNGKIDVSVSALDINDYVIQQFTGLTDKNNKEIYEGDIVKYKYRYHFDVECESINEVKFSNGCFYPLPINSIVDEDDFYSYYVSNYEIIGNIFENLELLK